MQETDFLEQNRRNKEANMKTDNIKKAMDSAILKAEETMNEDLGGPFGATVMSKEGKIISVSSNSVLGDHDPTAHAEINAIRQACQILKTHDLSDYVLVTTSFPCPMCLGAIMWSNIKEVIYGCRLKDAESIGFRDDLMYDFIKMDMKDKSVLEISEAERKECLRLFKSYHDQNKEIY